MHRDQDDVAVPALPIGVGWAAGRCRSHSFPTDIHPFFICQSSLFIYSTMRIFSPLWFSFEVCVFGGASRFVGYTKVVT
jgi:hypothetical protein